MLSFRLIATLGLTLAIVHPALAFEVDNQQASKSAAAKLSDPDEKIPFPHVADDGATPQNFQGENAQPKSGFSITSNPRPRQQFDAFSRAQDNMSH